MSVFSFVQINEVIVGLFTVQADINLRRAKDNPFTYSGENAVLLWQYIYSCFCYNDYPWGLYNDCIVHILSTPQGATWIWQLKYHIFF